MTSSRPRGGASELQVGASTRAALCLYRASQALAVVEGRDYVVPDDVKRLAVPVLAHRVIAKSYAHAGQRGTLESLIKRLVDGIAVPNWSSETAMFTSPHLPHLD